MKIIWSTILVLLLILKLTAQGNDLLNLFRPKPNLPQELNDFLLDVQKHKKDFAFIRNAATRQKNYEKTYAENNILFDGSNEDQPDGTLENENYILSKYNREEITDLDNNPSFSSPKRYSKFLHSPIRLRRELDVNVDHKSIAGEIDRPGIKNPVNDKNMYHTGCMQKRDDDKPKSYNADAKKKREVEISIKSDGKVIKKIDESENGPKSVIVNIKTSNEDCASAKFPSNMATARSQTMINIIQQPNTTPQSAGDFSFIPSINSNTNLNQKKNVAIPINAVSSNTIVNPQPYVANNFDAFSLQNEKNLDDLRAINKATKKLESNKNNGNNHMEKVIDTALNNQYDFEDALKEKESGSDMKAAERNTDFERVQGFVMDNANGKSNSNNNPSESNVKSMKKRKRWEQIDLDENRSILNPELGKINSNIETNENVNYLVSLEQELTTTLIDEAQNNVKLNSLLQSNKNEFYVNPKDRFHIVEESTKDIYIIPVTISECITDENVDIKAEEKEEEDVVDNAIEQGETEKTEEAEEEANECDDKTNNDNCDEKEAEPQEPNEEENEHIKTHNHEEHNVEADKMSIKKKSDFEKYEKIHSMKEFPLLPYNEANEGRYKKHLPTIPKYKKKRIRQHSRKKLYSERQFANSFFSDDSPEEALDFIPSYYQRRLKSIDYDYDPYLVDFDSHLKENVIEDSKELMEDSVKNDDYGNDAVKDSDDLFEEDETRGKKSPEKDPMLRKNRDVPMPEYMFHYYDPFQLHHSKRSLSSLDYEYNPKIIDDSDIKKHYDKGINKVENAQGIRKKMKSEEDYSDEEDSVLDMSNKKHKSNKKSDKRTEDNDDEYNYSEILNSDENINSRKETNLNEQSMSDNANVHRGQSAHSKKKQKNKKQKPNKDQLDNLFFKRKNRNASHKIKLARTLKMNKKNKDKTLKLVQEKKPKHNKGKQNFLEKPLTPQEKQDIFLRYNPEFQRWPRFLQDENRYRNLMEKRAMDNQRHFRNTYDRFPISNEYFVKPKRDEFVKREDQATTANEKTTTGSESNASTPREETRNMQESEAKSDQPATVANQQRIEQPINQNAADSATLPPAAKDILETAESDIFENTTVPELLGMENPNKTNELITPLVFTTNADDLTEGTECTESPKFSPCPDENVNHSPVTMTSILPIVSEDLTLLRANVSKDDYLDLNEILGGTLPKEIVSQSLSNAKGSIRRGLNAKRYNTNLKLSGFNNSLETKMILDEMSNLMLKLKYHTSCQQLPPELKSYLKIITRNDMDSVMDKIRDMEDVDFDEHQSSYVFHSGESENLQGKAAAMKQLLIKFNALPDNCKERAEPVKEYIESHLAMIDNMSGRNATNPAPAPNEHHPKTKKDVTKLTNEQEENLENQMMEEGLNNPNANANEVIEDIKKNKREADETLKQQEISTSTSQQFGRLAEAVRKLRNRRENEKRINQIYGKAKRSASNGIEIAKNRGFVSPLTINF